jgi:acyl carrier protein phosphodiesterase
LNYLAHAYLSFGSEYVLVGNMVSDFVKGKAMLQFPLPIQRGIRLHRLIDSFTDAHPVNKAARQYLAPAVARYSGAFLDIIYDHFLATDASRFAPGALKPFTAGVYARLRQETPLLPPPFLQTLGYMEKYDWLFHYSMHSGIQRSLEGLARRATYLPDDAPVYSLFEQHYAELGDSYRLFFPELEAYTRQQFAL